VNTPLPEQATATITPTPTAGPYEYVVQANDNCYNIAARHGHNSPAAVGAIEDLNHIDCGSLQAGQTILVPRPTATATPQGADMTQTAVATSIPPMMTLSTGPQFSLQAYTVQEGQALSEIAILNDSSLQQLCALNTGPDGIDCSACQWESPHCCCTSPILLRAGQQINVPAPTPTPTMTPTLTGSETPTLTPTHRAPQALYPVNGSTISGLVRLTWISVGPLAGDEYYLVTVRDQTAEIAFTDTTRQLSLEIPRDYLPTDGQAHTYSWQVSVARLGSDGYFYPVGSVVPEQSFTWTAS
jgi:hypothetical protein